MGDIMPAECSSQYRFGIHKRKYYIDGHEVDHCMVVVRDVDTSLIKRFLYLGDYAAYKNTEEAPSSITGIAAMYSIVSFLNYVFIDNWARYGIKDLGQITVRHVQDYLDYYADTKTKSGWYPSRQTVKTRRDNISRFLAALTGVREMKLREDEIVEYKYVRKRNNDYGGRFVPQYKIPYRYHNEPTGGYKILNRDMPLSIADRMIAMAETYDPEITFGLVLELYVGLRSGEVCNVRQNTSIYGPCFRLTYSDRSKQECIAIEIDLMHEYPMRSDGKSVGRIKVERSQGVFSGFVPRVEEFYRRHLNLIKEKPVEQSRPMFLCKRPDKKSGVYKAMTVSGYRDRVSRLFLDHVLPSCKDDADPRLRRFYDEMQGHTWGPHSCRHWYTVVLILCGVDNTAELENYRGDRSPRSAIVYLERKGELNRLYSNAVKKLGGMIRK